MLIHEDRLFPAEPGARAIAKSLYAHVRNLPIISPHGHTQAAWFAQNLPFPNPAQLLVQPDHYVFRMLYSQGVPLEDLEIGVAEMKDPRKVWRIFASHFYLFRGTPSWLWLNFVFQEVFGLTERFGEKTADLYYDTIAEKLALPEFRPRALFDRFNIEVLSTTDSPLDSLHEIQTIQASEWKRRILPAFRPDSVVDPEFAGFSESIAKLGEQNSEDTSNFAGYLNALRKARLRFKALGCTSTDHGHLTAKTADLSKGEAEALFQKCLSGKASLDEKVLFQAQMLTEMALMSLEDGLVMQIHPGSTRNHNRLVYKKFGRDVGADIPRSTGYVDELRPLLDRVGNESKLTIILFTLDETSYSRELAPLAGHYPCLRLGPAWWFHDSPEGMLRYRQQVTETAGFYNTVGFNDDTRAFLSIPARHDVARRMDCGFLAKLVTEHRLEEDEAFDVAHQLAYGLAKQAYRL
jgi:glucuronate isomerase